VDWDEAVARVREIIRGAGGAAAALVSPHASTEALFLARRLLAPFSWTGAFQFVVGQEAPLAAVPNLALRAERAPNVRGAELLGYGRDFGAARAAAEQAAVVLVLDEPQAALQAQGKVLYLGTTMPDASALQPDLVLPIANTAEEDGTFVNRDGRVQRYFQAKPAPGMARPAWWVLGQLVGAAAGGGGEGKEEPGSAEEAFAQLADAVDAFHGLSYGTLGLTGRTLAVTVEAARA
jgi:NADH-quinone oxidoreductase subunit G